MGKWSKYRAGRAPGLPGTPWGSKCQQSNKTQNVKPDPSSKAYKYQISVEALAGPFSNRFYKIPLLCGGHTLPVQGVVKTQSSWRRHDGVFPWNGNCSCAPAAQLPQPRCSSCSVSLQQLHLCIPGGNTTTKAQVGTSSPHPPPSSPPVVLLRS